MNKLFIDTKSMRFAICLPINWGYLISTVQNQELECDKLKNRMLFLHIHICLNCCVCFRKFCKQYFYKCRKWGSKKLKNTHICSVVRMVRLERALFHQNDRSISPDDRTLFLLRSCDLEIKKIKNCNIVYSHHAWVKSLLRLRFLI